MERILIVLIAFCMSFNSTLADARYTGSHHSRIPFYILNAASEYGLDADLMYALCTVESRCHGRALNRNDGTPEQKAAGIKIKSYGLFQIKVATAETVGFVGKTTVTVIKKRRHKEVVTTQIVDHGDELLNPVTNSLYAAKLIHKLYKRYGSTEKVLSAYNAGHPIKGNKDYVYKVLKAYAELKIDKRN